MTEHTTRRAGLYAAVAAVLAFVVSPLLAMSYFATPEGADELETASVAAWAEPGADLAAGLLTFASPEGVYVTYSLVMLALVPAILVGALAVRARRPRPFGRLERWGWRLALIGYTLFTLGLATVSLLALGDLGMTGVVDIAFVSMMIPGLLVSLIGSTVLGIALLRNRYRPPVTGWLLALSFPAWILGSVALGHNSIGLLALFVAWGASGLVLWRAPTHLGAEPLQITH